MPDLRIAQYALDFLSRSKNFLMGFFKESFKQDRLLWLALVLCFGFSLIGA